MPKAGCDTSTQNLLYVEPVHTTKQQRARNASAPLSPGVPSFGFQKEGEIVRHVMVLRKPVHFWLI